jgi:hypothetical protein
MKRNHKFLGLNLFILSLSILPATTWSLDQNQSKVARSKTNTSKIPVDESLPIYVSTRLTKVIPEDASSDALALGLGVGLADQSGSFFGLRLIWIPQVPKIISSKSNDIQSAWGPVLEWQNLFSSQGRLSFFSNVAAGFIYDTPSHDDDQQGKFNKTTSKNEVLPVLELGFGLKVVSKPLGAYRFFIAPELGYIFTGRAPYACVSIGVY